MTLSITCMIFECIYPLLFFLYPKFYAHSSCLAISIINKNLNPSLYSCITSDITIIFYIDQIFTVILSFIIKAQGEHLVYPSSRNLSCITRDFFYGHWISVIDTSIMLVYLYSSNIRFECFCFHRFVSYKVYPWI